jgi:LuxR family transcriptional regulator, maltose regulon positive regulatory protein
MFVVPRLALARLRESTGDGARAWELVAEARTQIAPAAIVLNQRVLETETLLAIEAGELDRAEASVEQLLEPCRSRMNARVALARDDVATARTAIDNVTATTARDRIDTLLTRAQCAASPEETTVLVRAALEIGEPEGFLRTFSIERGWIRPTLVQLIGEWPTGYVSEVVDAIDHEPANPATLFAELTPRELQVLRYLATSFSMLEVAGALSISRNTLKTHARAIYRKLRVPGRHEAVALLRRTTRGSSPQ